MGNIIVGTMFIIIANILMMFAGAAMLSANPDSVSCYHMGGSILSSLNSSMSADILTQIPGAQEASVTTGTTTIFTDIFNNIASFFKGVGVGLAFLTGIVTAPVNIFGCMNIPVLAVLGLSLLWYGTMLIIFFSYLWGRD